MSRNTRAIMDTIVIEDLRVDAKIGVHEWEQCVKQTLLLTIELDSDVVAVAATDRLEDAIDYSAVASHIRAFCAARHFQLLETLAVQLVELLLAEFPVHRVKIHLRKPTAIAQAQSAGIRIERRREKT